MPETPVQFLAWKYPLRTEKRAKDTPGFAQNFMDYIVHWVTKSWNTIELIFTFMGKIKLDPHHKTKHEINCSLKFKGIIDKRL